MEIKYSNISFNRALTQREKQAYITCINHAKKELNLKESIAILFDYSVPSEKNKNLGIGTTFSDNAQKFVNFIKEYCGINAILLNPQGILKDNTNSPYSATSLSIGEHIIDLFKLTGKKYENLLSESDIKKFLINENPENEYKTDYKRLVRKDYTKPKQDFVFSNLLNRAFDKFKKLPQESILVRDYNIFLKENNYRLEKESLYYALSERYGSTQWQNWDDYKYLFMEPDSLKTANTVKRLKKELKNDIDYFNFVQFIAEKQQQSSKKAFNKNGIKVLGDIPISFSPAEQWANKSIFSNNYCFGYQSYGNYYDWGSPAPDLDEFYQKREKITDLYKKRLFANFKRYDGIRIDVAWAMFNPCIVKWNPVKSFGKIITNLGDNLFYLIESTGRLVKKEKYNPQDVYLELLGSQNELENAMKATKNRYPHLLVTLTTDSARHYTDNDKYIDGKFVLGIGTHDNPSLIDVSQRLNNQDIEIQNDAERLSRNMKINLNLKKIPSLYRILKLAELFTTQKQYFNIFDILGTKQCNNIWDSSSQEYWSDRVPINYEKTYFKNLTENKGLNLPEALYYALKSKQKNPNKNLLEELKNFSRILKEKGPLTEREANADTSLN